MTGIRERAGRNRRGNDDDRILPLINVVFLLLIFFMVAGRLSVSDPFPLAPPTSISDGRMQTEGRLLHMSADGRLALDGRTVTAAELAAALQSDRGTATGEIPVRVKADGAADTTRLVDLMEVLRRSGVATFQLVTLPSDS